MLVCSFCGGCCLIVLLFTWYNISCVEYLIYDCGLLCCWLLAVYVAGLGVALWDAVWWLCVAVCSSFVSWRWVD